LPWLGIAFLNRIHSVGRAIDNAGWLRVREKEICVKPTSAIIGGFILKPEERIDLSSLRGDGTRCHHSDNPYVALSTPEFNYFLLYTGGPACFMRAPPLCSIGESRGQTVA
jgi:hypothetical protein